MKPLSTRSGMQILIVLVMLGMISCTGKPGGEAGKTKPSLFYVGSGDWNLQNPIFLCELDEDARQFGLIDSFRAEGGAGYLDLSPDRNFLAATSSTSIPGDEGHSSVAIFAVHGKDHGLRLVNRQSSEGSGICYVRFSPDGSFVFAANYGSGQVAVLPVKKDSGLCRAVSVFRGKGSGPVESRQEGPHAHQAVTDPEGKFLLVPDLGTDKVMNYLFDSITGKLVPNPLQPYLEMPPGSGPRHLAFHPSGKFVFILSELAATLTACSFDPITGILTPINTAGIVAGDYTGNKQSAAVRVHPNGKFVYASNRSDESSLAVFRIEGDGSVNRIQIVDEVPTWPRDFNLSPDGRYLLVAGARANLIELFEVSEKTGMLSRTGATLRIHAPICILFAD